MRAAWPQHLPMSVRISAHDWVEGGITPDDAVEIARAFKAAGADMIDCSSGQVSKKQKPVYGRMYQTPFADRIRNEAGIATIAVGAISEADHVNSIIAAGRADLCAIARPHLANPAWTLHRGGARSATPTSPWPKQYRSAKAQLERNLERERAAGGAGRRACRRSSRPTARWGSDDESARGPARRRDRARRAASARRSRERSPRKARALTLLGPQRRDAARRWPTAAGRRTASCSPT